MQFHILTEHLPGDEAPVESLHCRYLCRHWHYKSRSMFFVFVQKFNPMSPIDKTWLWTKVPATRTTAVWNQTRSPCSNGATRKLWKRWGEQMLGTQILNAFTKRKYFTLDAYFFFCMNSETKIAPEIGPHQKSPPPLPPPWGIKPHKLYCVCIKQRKKILALTSFGFSV